jgi:hypothetical protein
MLRCGDIRSVSLFLSILESLSLISHHSSSYSWKKDSTNISNTQTGQTSPPLEVAKANETILLKNAEKAYRGAKNLALASGEEDLAREGKVKELIARVFWDREKVTEFIQEMNVPENLAVLFEGGGERLVFEGQVNRATGMKI